MQSEFLKWLDIEIVLFKVKIFADQLEFLSTEELQELVVDLYQNSLVQEKLFQKILGEYLGFQPAMQKIWGWNGQSAEEVKFLKDPS